MAGARLEIDLEKITHNARTLVDRLTPRGISVTGVTKATLGSPEIARALLEGGVCELGDSRIENIENMRRAKVSQPMSLIRSPMPSQAKRVVTNVELSYNSELDTVRRLSCEASKLNRTHGVVLMVELGDLREGFMPADLVAATRTVIALPNIVFRGIGTNLACRSGTSPDAANMGELSRLATLLESTLDISIDTVSGGNSANLAWIFGGAPAGRINKLRLGEAILLGHETLYRRPIQGLHTDAITLVAEVIESKLKPTRPCGDIAQTAFGVRALATDCGKITQTLLALGIQDVDPDGLVPPPGTAIIGSTSDHLVITSAAGRASIGSEVRFELNYSALLRAMTSPFVARAMKSTAEIAVLRNTC